MWPTRSRRTGCDIISLSANADDVCVLLRIQGDADIVKELEQYERASAKVNWGKSEAFLMGRWGASEKPRLPRGLQWDRADLKMLGVQCLSGAELGRGGGQGGCQVV